MWRESSTEPLHSQRMDMTPHGLVGFDCRQEVTVVSDLRRQLTKVAVKFQTGGSVMHGLAYAAAVLRPDEARGRSRWPLAVGLGANVAVIPVKGGLG